MLYACCITLIFLLSTNSLLIGLEANESPMTFQVIEPWHGTASICGPYVLANGIIEEDSYIKLDNFLKKNPKNKICFNSPGGDVFGGMNLGEYIRSKKMDTCLLKEYTKDVIKSYDKKKKYPIWESITVIDKPICASACFYAFVGGVNRVLENYNGMTLLGIHQFYTPNNSMDESNAQKLTTMGYIFLDKMGVKREILDYASMTPKDEITFLPSYVTRKYRINTNEPLLSEWTINVTDKGVIYGSVSQEHPNKDAITSLFLSNDNGKPTLTIFFTYSSDREIEKVLKGSSKTISLIVDNIPISNYEELVWDKIKGNTIATSLSITEYVLSKMSEGNILEIEGNVPNVIRDFDPSTEISLEGFRKIYLALFKN